MRGKFVAMMLVMAGFTGLSQGAQAAFMPTDTEPKTGEENLFINGANKDVTSFSGTVGKNNSGPQVNITTNVGVDTGNGYANIKPIKDAVLTDLTFTPVDDKLFNDFFFRGQLLDKGDITLTVTDAQGDPAQVFTFTVDSKHADFDSLGIQLAFPDTTSTIKSILLHSAGFQEVKQIDFSLAQVSPVPLPAALPLFGAGLAMLGVTGASRRRKAAQL